jgi:CRISPR-associated protein Cas4
LQVHSFQLGLFGVCDVVNFKPPVAEATERMSLAKRIEQQLRTARQERGGSLSPTADETTEPLIPKTSSGSSGGLKQKETPDPFATSRTTAFADWTITPVEYKRGKPKTNDCDRVQLCAQAMCLEEMLGVDIPHGDLFYGKRQRRTEVVFDQALRTTTAETTLKLHELIAARVTPSAQYEKKCDTCSLLGLCMPPKGNRSAAKYIEEMIK